MESIRRYLIVTLAAVVTLIGLASEAVAQSNGLVRNSNGTLSPAPGYDWLNPHDSNDLRVRSCGVIAGYWVVTTKDLQPMVVSQSGCNFTAAFWNGDGTILHEITGKVGVDERMTVVRKAPGCATEMYGNVFLGDSGLWWTIDGTSGGCGIDGHRETRRFTAAPTFQQAIAVLPFVGRVVRGVFNPTSTADRDVDMTHEPGMGPNPAAVGGGGGRPSEMRRDIP